MNKLSVEQQKLVLSLTPEVRKIAYYFTRRKDEDFEQTAVTILCELVGIGWTDPKYILYRLRDRLKDEIRYRQTRYKVRFHPLDGGESFLATGDGEDISNAIHDEMLSLLTDVERRAVEMKMEGYTGNEIAGDLGISRSTLYRLMSHVKEKISEYLAND